MGKDQDLPLPAILVPPPAMKFEERNAQLIEKKRFSIKLGSLLSSIATSGGENWHSYHTYRGVVLSRASLQALVPCKEADSYQYESLHVYLKTLKYFPTSLKICCNRNELQL